jgi:cell wall-associated NlpC family hydrolase
MGFPKQIYLALVFVATTVYCLGISAASAENQVYAPSSDDPAVATSTSGIDSSGVSNIKSAAKTPQTLSTPSPSLSLPESQEQKVSVTRENNTEVVRDKLGWLATFTEGSRSVVMRGPARTFSEPGLAVSVSHSMWVRILPEPFSGSVDQKWLDTALNDKGPDVLSVAMQYISGAPTLYDQSGRIFANDADYGPLQTDGTRQEGSDFNDYLGISYDYGVNVDSPEMAQLGSMDCSGYMRMVWGYRKGYPLTNQSDAGGRAIPRRAHQIYASSSGALVISQGTNAQAKLDSLLPGDLVFEDVSTNDGAAIDHVGMYIGRDTSGNYRFISSRKVANGPTFGDNGGKSVLNGTGLYAKGFVSAKRL